MTREGSTSIDEQLQRLEREMAQVRETVAGLLDIFEADKRRAMTAWAIVAGCGIGLLALLIVRVA